MLRSAMRSLGHFATRNTLWIGSLMALFTAIVPVTRAFFRLEIDYNEGWNIYNTQTVVNHHLLYPAKYGWTTVNYPLLSFYLLAQLHRLTHDYLFTARFVSLLSLIGCCLLVTAIVHALQASWRSASLAGLFCFAVFCSDADFYVGMDDPQMLAQLFFLTGLLLYLRNRTSRAHLIAAAFLFVLGGFTKHNLIDIPLAVVIDLALISIPLALWFSLCGIALTALGVLLNIHAGGPFFLSQLLAPRTYSLGHVLAQCIIVLGPLLLPLVIAIYTAIHLRRDPTRRITAILLGTALVIDACFSGGNGVSINALFSSFLAMSILIGLFTGELKEMPTNPNPNRLNSSPLAPTLAWLPALLFFWLVIPTAVAGNLNIVQRLRENVATQRLFDQNVAWLKSRPGPALCESLLLCAYAQKPYLYDPFNATRLIRLQKLDPIPLLEQLNHRQFAAIQLSAATEDESTREERFTPAILSAIQANYTPVLKNSSATLYEPRFQPQ